MSECKYLQYSIDDRLAIWSKFGKTEKTVRQDVESLKSWMKKLGYLPGDTSDRKLEFFLILNKFSVEKTKRKVELYYTIRSFLPRIYGPTYATSSTIRDVFEHAPLFPLPKLHENCRIILAKVVDEDSSCFSTSAFGQIWLQTIDLIAEFDCIESAIGIIDLTHFTMTHAVKIDFLVCKDLIFVIQKVFSRTVTAIHIFNPPKVFESLMVVFKTIVQEKVMKRIQYHTDLESLQKQIPKEYLPRDYGGLQKSVQELAGDWKDFLKEQEPFFQSLNGFKVDKSLKPEEVNDDFYGYQGNFRKLEID